MTTPRTQIADPDLRSLLLSFGRELFGRLNCHQVGEVVSFDAGKQTATIKIAMNKQVVDSTTNPPRYVYKPYPLLTDCPVCFFGGAGGSLTFPVSAGDPCLVLFNDRDLDNWYSGGANTPPNSDRQHDLSDGIALLGVRNQAGALTDFNEDYARLAFGGGELLVGDKLALNGQDSTLRAVLEKVVTALTALNAKTGPSAATQILAVTTEINNLLQP